jgi:ACR3 family arsenite efflux pump ArsB
MELLLSPYFLLIITGCLIIANIYVLNRINRIIKVVDNQGMSILNLLSTMSMLYDVMDDEQKEKLNEYALKKMKEDYL